MKTYMTPALDGKGGVTESTRTLDISVHDPKDPFRYGVPAPGSAGFQL